MDYFSNKRNLFLQVALFLALTSCMSIGASVTGGSGVKWETLFDGKTLAGWEVRGGFAKYHVENGMIVGTTVEGSPNTFLCTKKRYGDFILDFDAKMLEFEVKEGARFNSGVQIRSDVYEADETVWVWSKKREMANKAGDVYGYQVEIANGIAHSGGIWDEARRRIWLHDISSDPVASKAFKDSQWNKCRVVCIGDSLKVWVNGVPCADVVDSTTLTGFIGLQVHSFKGEQPAQARWRNIRIRDLGRHVWKPLFDGKTLQGWHAVGGGKWQVSNGIIEGISSSGDKHGLLVSDERYGDFTARLKFKALKGNSGFFFRLDKGEGGGAIQGFQAEIDASENVGGLYESGGRKWVVQPSPEDVERWFKPLEWNQMTVSAHGRRIVVHVNDQKTAELKEDTGRPKGHLALQLHGGKQELHVMFKDVEILVPKE